MSFNLNNPLPSASGNYYTSPTYTDAVNDAQFVRTFGIVALVGSILIFLGGGVTIGVGLAVIGFGSSMYYRALGGTIVGLGLASLLGLGILTMLAPIVLGIGIIYKGSEILGTLSKEGKGDPDWQPTRSRAILGMALGGAAIFVSLGWIVLAVIGFIYQGSARQI